MRDKIKEINYCTSYLLFPFLQLQIEGLQLDTVSLHIVYLLFRFHKDQTVRFKKKGLKI